MIQIQKMMVTVLMRLETTCNATECGPVALASRRLLLV